MGRLGDCKVCYERKAPAVDKAHAAGESNRSIARRLGIPEATVRRHIRLCAPRLEEAPAPKRPARPAAPAQAKPEAEDPGAWVTAEPAPAMPLAKLREVAGAFPVPLSVLACAVSDAALVEVTTETEAEEEDLLDLFEEGRGLLAGLRFGY